MNEPRVAGLRSIDLGVTDLARSASFYTAVWGLELVAQEPRVKYFRALGAEHHAVCLRQASAARLERIGLAAPDRATVDALALRAQRAGFNARPMAFEGAAGGGYGTAITGPEGLRMTIACEVAAVPALAEDPTRPLKLTHVVINSEDVPAQVQFFVDVLGFKVSDTTARMVFMRCGTDHHSLAFANGSVLSLNHAAFEMCGIDGLMYGAGRLIEHGHEIEWGLGRHGPGSNVFAYFIDPDGFSIEYTTEMAQLDDDHVPQDVAYWAGFPKRPCRWGVARKPSERLMASMSGALLARSTGEKSAGA